MRVICARFDNLKNQSNNWDLDSLRNQYAENLRTSLFADFVKTDEILAGFRTLHEKIGRSTRKFPASPEFLINLFLSKGVIADQYNRRYIQPCITRYTTCAWCP